MNIPFWNRLSTRLSILIVLIVLVLAGATAILIIRGFNRVSNNQQGIIEQLEQNERGILEQLGERGITTTSDLPSILGRIIVNLVAIFLLTLVGATVFSRTLLTDPINSLVMATEQIASGNLGVTLDVKAKDEVGLLARTFNQMSTTLASRTRELEQSNYALRQSEARLEGRVQERTAELEALLELSNSIALTVDDRPLLETILTKLHDITKYRAAAIYELLGQSVLEQVLVRGDFNGVDETKLLQTVERKTPLIEYDILFFPLFVRDHVVGVLVLETGEIIVDEKLPLIAAFANQAGVAFENTKLYKQVQEKAALDERQHLARELHDSVSQALYSIVLGAHAARKQLEQNPVQAKGALEYVENLAEAGLAEMRALIFELRPEVLEKEGLAAALRKQVEALEVRHKIKADFSCSNEPNLPFASKQTLYRVAQEAMHNIVKHAKATYVNVSLQQHGDCTRLTISDNGIGFDTTQEFVGHLGLKSMRERALGLGGNFEIVSSLNEGTTLKLEVPNG
jgi:signal transduction histidine kinase